MNSAMNAEIPSSLNHNFLSIMEASVNAGEELIPAARAYFKSPYTVREKLLKVFYFESETDKIFQDLHSVHLFRNERTRSCT